MELSKKRSGADAGLAKKPMAGKRSSTIFFAALGAAVVLALFLVWWIDGGARGLDLQRLVGRWQRTDGNYVLEIRKVDPDGTVEARYFNPNPINVAAARASMEEGLPRLSIELRDANYPGSTYALDYSPANDELVGVYFQAVEDMTFDVAFKRKGPP